MKSRPKAHMCFRIASCTGQRPCGTESYDLSALSQGSPHKPLPFSNSGLCRKAGQHDQINLWFIQISGDGSMGECVLFLLRVMSALCFTCGRLLLRFHHRQKTCFLFQPHVHFSKHWDQVSPQVLQIQMSATGPCSVGAQSSEAADRDTAIGRV